MTTRIKAMVVHAGISVLIALLAYLWIFNEWYPSPFDQVTGGRSLFLILISVDVVCGPALTAIVFNVKKLRSELIRDMSFLVMLQLVALGYGLWSLYQARPVVVGFERDRFRVVTAAELLYEEMAPLQGNGNMKEPTYKGVRLLTPDDPDYLSSIRLASEGIHPSARPSRWVDFEKVAPDVATNAKPFMDLKSRYRIGREAEALNAASIATNLPPSGLGYYPLVSRWVTDWVVVVDRHSGRVIDIVHADGW